MDTLPLKLLLTPLLIGAVSLAGRRWGPGVSGWLVGLPFTSGPVVFILALDQGPRFAMATATAVLAGTVSEALFCLVYARLASRVPWPVAAPTSWLAFFAATALLRGAALPPLPVLFLAMVAMLGAALALLPRAEGARAAARLPWWDIPARMLVATAFVLALTGAAPALGPRLSGLLAPFPIYGSILAIFTQQLEGPAAAVGLLHGLALGLFSFAAFFLAVAALLVPAGPVAAFAAATATALLVQGGSLAVLKRPKHS
jgi:hypothetical protein